MDKPNIPAPSNEGQDHPVSSAVVNPAPNFAFGGAVEHHAGVPQILNTYTAAAAAIAMAKQQVAQSLQPIISSSSQQMNVVFSSQTTTNANAQPAPSFPQSAQNVEVAHTNSLAANNSNDVTTQNTQQAAPVNAVQQLAFPFPPQHLVAALLGGGLLPLANQSLAPAQQNNIQQQLANTNMFNGNTGSNQSAPQAASGIPTPKANVNAARDQLSAAAAQVVAAHAAAASSGAMVNSVFANMQNWTLEQLGKILHPNVGDNMVVGRHTYASSLARMKQSPMFSSDEIRTSQYLNL